MPDATRDEIEAAARAAEAHDFILRLPEGYDTVVGEQGLTLSGGQRQRVALARALLSNPKILLLDDATSSIDSRIEEEIHATLRRIASTRTTILIAHRRSSLSLADRIVVVDQGRVLDAGTHEALWARCALYRMLLSGPGGDAEGDEALAAAFDTEQVDGITPVGVAGARRRGDPQRADRRAHAHREPDRRGARRRAAEEAVVAAWVPAARGAARSRRRRSCSRRSTRSGPRPPTRTSTSRRRAERRPISSSCTSCGATATGCSSACCSSRSTRCAPSPGRSSCGTASTDGVAATPQNPNAVWAASFVFLVIVLIDWYLMWAEARVMGRVSERMLHALRVQGVRAPAATRRRLLRARDGGPDHDPHDHRHRRARRSCSRTVSSTRS